MLDVNVRDNIIRRLSSASLITLQIDLCSLAGLELPLLKALSLQQIDWLFYFPGSFSARVIPAFQHA